MLKNNSILIEKNPITIIHIQAINGNLTIMYNSLEMFSLSTFLVLDSIVQTMTDSVRFEWHQSFIEELCVSPPHNNSHTQIFRHIPMHILEFL